MSRNLVVAVRVRPLSAREEAQDVRSIIEVSDKHVKVSQPISSEDVDGKVIHHAPRLFSFDNAYGSSLAEGAKSTQDQIYDDLGRSLIDKAFEGYNCCIFAYGQTGSGKSYTMMGTPDAKGLIPLICDELFRRLSESSAGIKSAIEVSYLEIYSEKVRDLLNPQSRNLRVREHAITGPYVEGLARLAATSFVEIETIMQAGNKQRTIAATEMNAVSSRSHAIFSLVLTQRLVLAGVETEKVSKVSLVDLAGSERAQRTGATGARLKEGAEINKSLSTLGRVISALASQENSRRKSQNLQVPYRDSTLTWLLKDSLGGNSLTAMIATISPAKVDYHETLSTLRYADSAKNIKTHAIVNEDQNVKMIRDLRDELALLRAQMTATSSTNAGKDLSEQMIPITGPDGTVSFVSKAEIAEKMEESRKLIEIINLSWEDKLEKTRLMHQDLESKLEDLGVHLDNGMIGLTSPRKVPYLVNLSEELPQCELLVYSLKSGLTRCGNVVAGHCDIKLSGDTIHAEHCHFENIESSVTVKPTSDSAAVMVNGIRIYQSSALKTGDRIVLGVDKSHIFRFNHPGQNQRKQIDNTVSPSRESGLELKVPHAVFALAVDQLDNPTSRSEFLTDTEAQAIHFPEQSQLDLDLDTRGTASDHRKRDSQAEMLVQTLNAERLEAESRGRVQGTSLLERLTAVRHDAEEALRAQSLSLPADTQIKRWKRYTRSEVMKTILMIPRSRWTTEISRCILENGHTLKHAQILAVKGRPGISIQFCIIDAKSLLISPYEDDSVYEDMVSEAKDDDPDIPRLMIRIIDQNRGVLCLWSMARLQRRLVYMTNASQARLGNQRTRLDQLLEKPLPRYSLFGRAVLPIVCSKSRLEKSFALDIYNPYTSMNMAVLKVEIIVMPDETAEDSNCSVLHLKINSILGLNEKELTEVHVHAYFSKGNEARLTTPTISNFADRIIVLGSRHSCMLRNSEEPESIVFEIYGLPQPDFFSSILSWDELQEAPNAETQSNLNIQSASLGCTVVKIGISELGGSGTYTTCEVISPQPQEGDIFQLHQGLSRRISLSVAQSDHSFQSSPRLGNFKIRNVAAISLGSSPNMRSQDTEAVPLKVVVNQPAPFATLKHGSVTKAVCQWDSSMHNSKYLDRVTPADHCVGVELVFDWQTDDQRVVELVVPLNLQIRGRDEQPGYLARIFTYARISSEATFLFTLPNDPPDRPIQPSMYKLDSSNDYIPGQELLRGWKPRGLSLLRNYLTMTKLQQLSIDHQRTMMSYSDKQLCVTSQSPKSGKLDLRGIISYWQKLTERNRLTNLEAEVLASYPAQTETVTCRPSTLHPAVHAGELSTYTAHKAQKAYCVIRPPFLLQYTAANQMELVSAMYLPLYKIKITAFPLEFRLYNTHIEHIFLAPSPDSKDAWIEHTSLLALA